MRQKEKYALYGIDQLEQLIPNLEKDFKKWVKKRVKNLEKLLQSEEQVQKSKEQHART